MNYQQTDIDMESILLIELSSLAEYNYVKTLEELQNTGLYMREFLGIDKALKTIHVELANNTSKLTNIIERIKKRANS